MTARAARLGALGAALALGAIALALPALRRALLHAVVTDPARPGPPPALAQPDAPTAGLPPAAQVRVALIDGVDLATARMMPAWSALCARGVDAIVDVGFPTVSLPVELALWSGLTQQQRGVVYHAGGALVPPLDEAALPAQIAGSWAVAEAHPEIVGSLGFHRVEVEASPAWAVAWPARARAAVASDARLAFVHVLGVDAAGHRAGAASRAYRDAAATADALLAALVAAAPDARWLVLADHGHLAGGGHGGEERALRQVRACLAGPGIEPAHVGPLHLVDLSAALAASLGGHLPAASAGRPWAFAIAHPLIADEAVPPWSTGDAALAAGVLALGAAVTAWAAGRRAWAWPWWLVLALGGLVLVRGAPTLSTPMIYAPRGDAMAVTWLPALALVAVTTWGAGRAGPTILASLGRALLAQLALPSAVAAAALTAAGAWPTALGAEVAPVVPLVTAWTSPLLLLLAHGAAAAALAALATAARPPSGRP